MRTLVSKTKRKLRFFQEVFQDLRREATVAGLFAEIGHHSFQSCGFRHGHVLQPKAEEGPHLPLIGSRRGLVCSGRFAVYLNGDRLRRNAPHLYLIVPEYPAIHNWKGTGVRKAPSAPT